LPLICRKNPFRYWNGTCWKVMCVNCKGKKHITKKLLGFIWVSFFMAHPVLPLSLHRLSHNFVMKCWFRSIFHELFIIHFYKYTQHVNRGGSNFFRSGCLCKPSRMLVAFFSNGFHYVLNIPKITLAWFFLKYIGLLSVSVNHKCFFQYVGFLEF